MSKTKEARRLRIKKGVRAKITGTAARPRLSVFRSNMEIYGQLIDDLSGVTLVSASSRNASLVGTKVEISAQVGKLLASKAVKSGISQVVFDRNGYLYHGRVKAFADGAREGGLNF